MQQPRCVYGRSVGSSKVSTGPLGLYYSKVAVIVAVNPEAVQKVLKSQKIAFDKSHTDFRIRFLIREIAFYTAPLVQH